MRTIDALNHLIYETHHLDTRKRFTTGLSRINQIASKDFVAYAKPVLPKQIRCVFQDVHAIQAARPAPKRDLECRATPAAQDRCKHRPVHEVLATLVRIREISPYRLSKFDSPGIAKPAVESKNPRTPLSKPNTAEIESPMMGPTGALP